MQQTFNPKAPANAGVTFTGLSGLVTDQATPGNLTGPMVGKAAQDSDKRWTMGLLPANAAPGGVLVGDTMVLVNSQGHATPAQVTGVVGWTTNGNLRVTVKRLPLPDAVKAVRKSEQDAQKAQYKTAGPQARQPQAAQPLPSLPGQAPAQPVTPAPEQAAPAQDIAALVAGMTAEQFTALLKGLPQAQSQAGSLPSIPTPKAPRGKAAGK